jgi:Protein of unknown function (DUF3489)
MGYFRATIATCKNWRSSAHAVVMPKTPPKAVNTSKVVPLTQERRRVIARDDKCQRVIIGIGSQRIAFDIFTRVTHLPRGTGDQPAPVLPMNRIGRNLLKDSNPTGAGTSTAPVPAAILGPNITPLPAQNPYISLDSLTGQRDGWSVKQTTRLFNINADNTTSALTSDEKQSRTKRPGCFTNEQGFAALAAQWPTGRLVEIWNNLPGVRKITKFTDRQTGVRRIWKAIEQLEPQVGAQAASGGDKVGSRGRAASQSEQSVVARVDTKAARVIALLKQPSGATLKAIMALTKWQSHSVRGFITAHVRKKLNYRVQSFKRAGERVYRIQT